MLPWTPLTLGPLHKWLEPAIEQGQVAGHLIILEILDSINGSDDLLDS